jgi:amino acid permease
MLFQCRVLCKHCNLTTRYCCLQTFNLPALVSERSNTIVALTVAVLLPLCSLKSLSALAPFSLLGLGGTLYTAIFMAIRYFDGSYRPGGRFFEDILVKPSFGQRGGYSVMSFNAFVLVSMMSTAFVAHYNAPAFMNELKDATVPRFNQVVNGGFAASIALFIFIMSIGFMTFGGSSAGFVLNNYSNKDVLATVARFAIGLALITGFPFTFSALRDGVLDLAKAKGPTRDAAFAPVTIGGLALLTALALVLKDVGFVVSISGAMFGCAVMFIIPAIMNIANIKNKRNILAMSGVPTNEGGLEVAANYGMMLTGIAMAVIGVSVSVLREMGKL